MTILRIPGYSAGGDIGGEPSNWLVYNTETRERHYEANPNYVPPPPLTERERMESDIAELEWRLQETRAALAALPGADG